MNPTSKVIESVTHFIHHYFIWVIVASYFVAALLPGFGIWIREAELGSVTFLQSKLDISLPPLMLSLLLFNAGLGVKPKEFNELAHQPQMLLGGLLGGG